MTKEYTVLDENGEASGLLEMAICHDHSSFTKVMNFDWASDGFQFFETGNCQVVKFIRLQSWNGWL
jgi:hypothetical protein